MDNVNKIREFIKFIADTATREIQEELNISKSEATLILQNDLHMEKVCLQWIPHTLIQVGMNKRVGYAKKLHNFLSKLLPKKLKRVLMEDEFWIYYDNQRNSIWIEYGPNIPTRTRHAIGSKKKNVCYNLFKLGFKSVTMLGENETFTKDFFVDHVLEDLYKKLL